MDRCIIISLQNNSIWFKLKYQKGDIFFPVMEYYFYIKYNFFKFVTLFLTFILNWFNLSWHNYFHFSWMGWKVTQIGKNGVWGRTLHGIWTWTKLRMRVYIMMLICISCSFILTSYTFKNQYWTEPWLLALRITS